MKHLIAIITGLFFLTTQNLARAQALEDPTTWTYEVKKKSANEYELVFHVSLKEGYHIFSQKPGDEFLIPPSFTFKGKNVKLVGKPVERGSLKSEVMAGLDNAVNYYEGSVDFVQTVKARPNISIEGEHEYQVCNDRMCLPPKTKPFVFAIKD
jgi:hypothetical protein